jgi:diguanylate cyclase (GGDEF)-like protein/PAS domain S-box-containing protein
MFFIKVLVRIETTEEQAISWFTVSPGYSTLTPMSQDELSELAQLRREVEHLRLIQQHSTDMISRHDLAGNYTYASPAALSLLGYEPDELVGHNAYEFFHPEDLDAIKRSHSAINELPLIYTVSYRIRRKDGSYIWFESTSKTIRDASGNVSEIISVSRDISERKKFEQQILRMANVDQLTGFLRPVSFTEELRKAIKRSVRSRGRISIFFIDMDKFKHINDLHGHAVGDTFLQGVAMRFRAILRETDICGRLGGDEFCIFVEDHASREEAFAAARRMIAGFQEPVSVGELALPIEFSMGVALFPDDGKTAEELLRRADTAMYKAKRLHKRERIQS